MKKFNEYVENKNLEILTHQAAVAVVENNIDLVQFIESFFEKQISENSEHSEVFKHIYAEGWFDKNMPTFKAGYDWLTGAGKNQPQTSASSSGGMPAQPAMSKSQRLASKNQAFFDKREPIQAAKNALTQVYYLFQKNGIASKYPVLASGLRDLARKAMDIQKSGTDPFRKGSAADTSGMSQGTSSAGVSASSPAPGSSQGMVMPGQSVDYKPYDFSTPEQKAAAEAAKRKAAEAAAEAAKRKAAEEYERKRDMFNSMYGKQGGNVSYT